MPRPRRDLDVGLELSVFRRDSSRRSIYQWYLHYRTWNFRSSAAERKLWRPRPSGPIYTRILKIYLSDGELLGDLVINGNVLSIGSFCAKTVLSYAFASSISTVTFSSGGSATLFVWFGDLLDFTEAAEAFPLLLWLPRRDPVRDPGDRDFLAKVSRALARQRGSTTRKARITLSMKTCAEEMH